MILSKRKIVNPRKYMQKTKGYDQHNNMFSKLNKKYGFFYKMKSHYLKVLYTPFQLLGGEARINLKQTHKKQQICFAFILFTCCPLTAIKLICTKLYKSAIY